MTRKITTTATMMMNYLIRSVRVCWSTMFYSSINTSSLSTQQIGTTIQQSQSLKKSVVYSQMAIKSWERRIKLRKKLRCFSRESENVKIVSLRSPNLDRKLASKCLTKADETCELIFVLCLWLNLFFCFVFSFAFLFVLFLFVFFNYDLLLIETFYFTDSFS